MSIHRKLCLRKIPTQHRHSWLTQTQTFTSKIKVHTINGEKEEFEWNTVAHKWVSCIARISVSEETKYVKCFVLWIDSDVLYREFFLIIGKNLIFTVYLNVFTLLSTDNKILQLIKPSMLFIEFGWYRYSPKIMP